MDTKTTALVPWQCFLLGCLMVTTIGSFVSCRKITGCSTYANGNEYLVELPVKLYPAKDTFDIGDTVWVEQIFHDQVHDQRNNMSLEFRDYFFAIWITLSDLLDFHNFPVKHSLTPVTGQLTRVGTGSMQIGYSHEQDTFKFRMHVVIKEKGLFQFGFLPNHTEANFTSCPNEYLDLRINLNGKGDNNYHMMQYSTDSVAIKASKEAFDQFGGYCFYVR